VLSKLLTERFQITHEEVNLADEVANNRPEPLRDYDQIYMRKGDLVLQTKLMAPLLARKRVAFVGDGDCMSLMLGMFGAADIIEPPEHMVVLDFDERVVQSIAAFAAQHSFQQLVETRLYNVSDPVPEDLAGDSDWFYTNPPYGSKNKGQSVVVFVDRGADLSRREESSGCVILPYGRKLGWARGAMREVQRYLLEKGYAISDCLQQVHQYHLEDKPTVRSSVLLVDRLEYVEPTYHKQNIPAETLETLYGDPRKPPRYIRADGSMDFQWE